MSYHQNCLDIFDSLNNVNRFLSEFWTKITKSQINFKQNVSNFEVSQRCINILFIFTGICIVPF